MPDNRERLIVAQVAVKAAVELRTAGDQTPIGELAGKLQAVIYKLADRPSVPDPLPPRATPAPLPPLPPGRVTSEMVAATGPPVNEFTAAVAEVQGVQTPAAASVTAVADMIYKTFPGTVDVTAAPPVQAQISAESPDEVLWADALRHNPQDWYDNLLDEKASVNGGKSPDYKHKTLKKGQFNLGLWAKSGSTPDWVKKTLGI